jgi:hypothetical protein
MAEKKTSPLAWSVLGLMLFGGYKACSGMFEDAKANTSVITNVDGQSVRTPVSNASRPAPAKKTGWRGSSDAACVAITSSR